MTCVSRAESIKMPTKTETPSVGSVCSSGESNDQFYQMFGVDDKSKLIMEGKMQKQREERSLD